MFGFYNANYKSDELSTFVSYNKLLYFTIIDYLLSNLLLNSHYN